MAEEGWFKLLREKVQDYTDQSQLPYTRPTKPALPNTVATSHEPHVATSIYIVAVVQTDLYCRVKYTLDLKDLVPKENLNISLGFFILII